MSIEEPTEVGTVVAVGDRSGKPRTSYWAIRCFTESLSALNWIVVDRDGLFLKWSTWDDLIVPVVVHDGYTPPTPEPMHHGARVIDAGELRCVRVWDEDGSVDGRPWASPRGELWAWSDLRQPVTVVSDGSDW